MTRLWLPSGNKKQTEIDTEIAVLDKYRHQAKTDLMIVRKDLIMIEADLKEVEECIKELKGEVLIVSISEYDLIQSNYYRLLEDKRKCLGFLRSIKDSLEKFNKQREKLIELREKAATKILEFDYERIKKRSQNKQ